MNGTELQQLIDTLGENVELFVIAGLALCFSLGIIFGAVTSICRNAGRERTRREIAAYIAEGSMTPEQGERLLRAEPDSDEA